MLVRINLCVYNLFRNPSQAPVIDTQPQVPVDFGANNTGVPADDREGRKNFRCAIVVVFLLLNIFDEIFGLIIFGGFWSNNDGFRARASGIGEDVVGR